jgi:hypothetical protein
MTSLSSVLRVSRAHVRPVPPVYTSVFWTEYVTHRHLLYNRLTWLVRSPGPVPIQAPSCYA